MERNSRLSPLLLWRAGFNRTRAAFHRRQGTISRESFSTVCYARRHKRTGLPKRSNLRREERDHFFLKLPPSRFGFAKGRLTALGQIEDKKQMAMHDVFKEHMEVLRRTLPEVRGLLLASSEGLPIAYSLSGGTDPHNVATMAAAASVLGRRIGDSLNVGNVFDISIHGEEGAIFFYAAGSIAVLAVICQKGSNIGLIHLEASATAKKISELFQQKRTRDSL